jgi:hypothetical protein
MLAILGATFAILRGEPAESARPRTAGKQAPEAAQDGDAVPVQVVR